MYEISSKFLNELQLKTNLCIPSELGDRKFLGGNSLGEELLINEFIKHRDPSWVRLKADVFGIKKPAVKGTYILEDESYLPNGDASGLACDMGITGFPAEKTERHPLPKISKVEREIFDRTVKFLRDNLELNDSTMTLDPDTSFGSIFTAYDDPSYYANALMLSYADSNLYEQLTKQFFDRNGSVSEFYKRTMQAIQEPIFIKIAYRRMVAKASKKFEFLNVYNGKVQEQFRSIMQIDDNTAKEHGMPKNIEMYYQKIKNEYLAMKLPPEFLEIIMAARFRTMFPCSSLNKSLSTAMNLILASFKKLFFPMCTQTHINYEPIRGCSFYNEFHDRAMIIGPEKAELEYRDRVTEEWRESFCLFYDFSAYDHSIPSNEQLDLCLDLYNYLLPEGLKVAHVNRVCPVVSKHDLSRVGKPFVSWDPFKEDIKYPLDFNFQSYSGESDVTITNNIFSLCYMQYATGIPIEKFNSLESRRKFCALLHGDDAGFIIRDPILLDTILTNLDFKFKIEDLNFDKIPTKFHSILKKHLGSETGPNYAPYGFKAKYSDKPEILKNIFFFDSKKRQVRGCHLDNRFFDAVFSREGNYNMRSSGSIRSYPYLGMHMRYKIYSDNPLCQQYMDEIDQLVKKYFKVERFLDLFPLSEEEEAIMNQETIDLDILSIPMQIFILENKPEMLSYRYSPEQFDPDLLKKYFLTLNLEEIIKIIDISKKKDISSLRKKNYDYYAKKILMNKSLGGKNVHKQENRKESSIFKKEKS